MLKKKGRGLGGCREGTGRGRRGGGLGEVNKEEGARREVGVRREGGTRREGRGRMEGSRGPGRAGQGGRREARNERRQGIEGAGNEGVREGGGGAQ